MFYMLGNTNGVKRQQKELVLQSFKFFHFWDCSDLSHCIDFKVLTFNQGLHFSRITSTLNFDLAYPTILVCGGISLSLKRAHNVG